MGTLSNLIEFQPFSMVPPGALGNPQTIEIFRASQPYAEPAHFTFYPPMGPFTAAGVSEVTGTEFIQGRVFYPVANAQIVSVPERPVDQGTFQAITANSKLQYTQPVRGVYNQPRQATVVNTTSVAGQAPTQGIYTGYGDGDMLVAGSSYGNGPNGGTC